MGRSERTRPPYPRRSRSLPVEDAVVVAVGQTIGGGGCDRHGIQLPEESAEVLELAGGAIGGYGRRRRARFPSLKETYGLGERLVGRGELAAQDRLVDEPLELLG